MAWQIWGLSDRFKKALACFAVAGAVAADMEWSGYDLFERPDGGNMLADLDPTCRRLTAGEIALAREVFGDSIDYTHVKIFSRPYMLVTAGHCGGMAPNGHIYVPEEHHWSEDYSQATGSQKGFFLHELSHVWQVQQGRDVRWEALQAWISRDFDYQKTYHYELGDDTEFSHLCLEQQADAVSYYFALRQVMVLMWDHAQTVGKAPRDWTAEEWRGWAETCQRYTPVGFFEARTWGDAEWRAFLAGQEEKLARYERVLAPVLAAPLGVPDFTPGALRADETMIANVVPPRLAPAP